MDLHTDNILAHTGQTLPQWQSEDWWPEQGEVFANKGGSTHYGEILVFFDDYGSGCSDNNWNGTSDIPEDIVDVLRAVLEGWHIDNRGNRLEAHPPRQTGASKQAATEEQLSQVKQALTLIGLHVETT